MLTIELKAVSQQIESVVESDVDATITDQAVQLATEELAKGVSQEEVELTVDSMVKAAADSHKLNLGAFLRVVFYVKL